MKRILVFALIFLSSITMVFPQEQIIPSLYAVQPLSEQMDSLLYVINNKEKELDLIKKDKAKVDSLDVLIDNYVLLVGMWQEEYKKVKRTSDIYNSLECLFSESDSVFNIELPNIALVPVSLKNHYNLINKVISIQNDIERVEREIEEKAQACIAINQDPIIVIPKLISPDLDAIYTMITEVKETGLSTFSEAQKIYFDENIRGRYNNFEKYFTNE